MGRPYCLMTALLISDGLEPRDAMAEAHRRREKLNRKRRYIPVCVLNYEEHERRKEYNRKWMAAYRERQRASMR